MQFIKKVCFYSVILATVPLSAMQLHRHVKLKNTGALVELQEAGMLTKSALARTDFNGRTPLHLAAERGYTEVIELFLAAGADPLARDATGTTPLHLACQSGHQEAVVSLLKKIQDPNIQDGFGMTPLHFAAKIGSVPLITLLKIYGASLTLVDGFGKLPSGWAATESVARALHH